MRIALSPTDQQGRFALDPFGAAPHLMSRIEGLGGHEAAVEPGYAFRTLPAASPTGPAAMRIRLHGLQAGRGNLAVDLVAVAARPDEAPVTLATHVVPLADLQDYAGFLTVPFEARAGMLYTVAGYIHEEGAVRAAAIEISLIAPADPDTVLGLPVARIEPVALPRLTSQEEPHFGNPVSQPMTRAQCRHPDFLKWARSWGAATPATVADDWVTAYPLQVLARYGALGAGARGLCLHGVTPELAAAIAGRGCRLLAQGPDAAPGMSEIPVRGMDFVLSIDLDADGGALRRAIHAGLERLVSGGLAVYIVSLGDARVRRGDIERAALDAIAFGHEVAQLKFGTRDRQQDAATIPFGMIIRRG